MYKGLHAILFSFTSPLQIKGQGGSILHSRHRFVFLVVFVCLFGFFFLGFSFFFLVENSRGFAGVTGYNSMAVTGYMESETLQRLPEMQTSLFRYFLALFLSLLFIPFLERGISIGSQISLILQCLYLLSLVQ